MHETYDKFIALLDANKAAYRLIDHLPEGQTDKVSAMRGHPVEAAAKCCRWLPISAGCQGGNDQWA